MTLLANMLMVNHAMQAAEELAREGIEAEVIDIRCLHPSIWRHCREIGTENAPGLDRRRGQSHGRMGAQVAAQLTELAFDDLDAPIRRVATPDTPTPCAPSLEKLYVPDVPRILEAVRDVVNGG